MQKIDLSGAITKKIVFDQGLQRLVFQNVSVNATVKVTVTTEGKEDLTPFPTMKIIELIEIQNKIKTYQSGLDKIMPIDPTALDSLDAVISVIPYAVLDIAKIGEITIGSNDTIIVELASMDKVKENSFVTDEGGEVKNGTAISISKLTYKANQDQREVPNMQTVDYLVFDKSKLPDEIVLYYPSETIRLTADLLKAKNYNMHNIVSAKTNNEGYSFGFENMLIFPTQSVKKVVVKDETNVADYSFYTVNK